MYEVKTIGPLLDMLRISLQGINIMWNSNTNCQSKKILWYLRFIWTPYGYDHASPGIKVFSRSKKKDGS